jgi:hypothetical protein
MTQHPITPPPELVQQLCDKAILHAVDGARRGEIEVWLIQEAFRAGADQELKACCEWLVQKGFAFVDEIRAARRPKEPSLKEQALQALSHLLDGAAHSMDTTEPADYIRRALEQLDD